MSETIIDDYTPCQQRVADFLIERSNNAIGAGDDPIGFLMASYAYCHHERSKFKETLKDIANASNAAELHAAILKHADVLRECM